jgi:hypothetical protein
VSPAIDRVRCFWCLEIRCFRNRATQFQKVQQSVASYRERLEICKEWKIPAEATVIPNQIRDDITLNADEKLALAIEFDIAPDLVTEQKT